jgi:hypothetical protein
MESRTDHAYPATAYERAAETLADIAEDLMYCEEDVPGEHLSALQAAWQHFVEVAAPCFDRGTADAPIEEERGELLSQALRVRNLDAGGAESAIPIEDLPEMLGEIATNHVSIAVASGALDDLQRLKPSDRVEVVEALKDIASDPRGSGMKRLKPISDWPKPLH